MRQKTIWVNKTCTVCAVEKPIDQFYTTGRKSPCGWCKVCCELWRKSYYAANREAILEQQRAYNKENAAVINQKKREKRINDPQKLKDQRIKRVYGLSPSALKRKMSEQGQACSICKEPLLSGIHIDHDHACCTGKSSCGKCVRGLLCEDCNRGLGSFRDVPSRLRSAALYLETYQKTRERYVVEAGNSVSR